MNRLGGNGPAMNSWLRIRTECQMGPHPQGARTDSPQREQRIVCFDRIRSTRIEGRSGQCPTNYAMSRQTEMCQVPLAWSQEVLLKSSFMRSVFRICSAAGCGNCGKRVANRAPRFPQFPQPPPVFFLFLHKRYEDPPIERQLKRRHTTISGWWPRRAFRSAFCFRRWLDFWTPRWATRQPLQNHGKHRLPQKHPDSRVRWGTSTGQRSLILGHPGGRFLQPASQYTRKGTKRS